MRPLRGHFDQVDHDIDHDIDQRVAGMRPLRGHFDRDG